MSQEISPERMAAYVRGARQRELAERKLTASELAQTAAHLLKGEFGATRIVLFGSVAHGHWFHRRSDIDLAVGGVPAALFFRAWRALVGLDDGFDFDLVDIETASRHLRQTIELDGIEL